MKYVHDSPNISPYLFLFKTRNYVPSDAYLFILELNVVSLISF